MSRTSFIAFVTGGLAAAVGAWLVADLRAQSRGAFHVCAASNGVLRVADTSAICQAGETSLYLFPQAQTLTPDDSKANQSALVERKLADLERHAKDLERWAPGKGRPATAIAPFEVADRDDKTVFSVTSEDAYGTYVRLVNGARSALTMIGVDNGSILRVSSPKGQEVEFKARTRDFGIAIRDGSGKSVELGRDTEVGTYRLKFFARKGSVAGIGQSRETDGSGLAYVADAGVIKARMYVTQDSPRGKFSISKDGDNEIALISEGENGGGVLKLYDSSGKETMVDAGVAAGGFGLVRAGPGAIKSHYGVLGLPGSYISGKPQ